MRKSIISIMFVVATSVMAEEVHTVPLDIRSYFSKNNCEEIFSYYSDSKIIEKPYFYGVASLISNKKLLNDYSFIAWCKSITDKGENSYRLVGELGTAMWPGNCNFPIDGFDYPGGLSIEKRTSGYVIRSEKDGLVYEVVCNKKNWIKINID